MDQDKLTRIQRAVESVFRAQEWKRLRMVVNGQAHDADRELVVREARRILTLDLTEFRRKAQRG